MEKDNSPKILITGAGGFIGRNMDSRLPLRGLRMIESAGRRRGNDNGKGGNKGWRVFIDNACRPCYP